MAERREGDTDPYAEFCQLAKEYRARQSLVYRESKSAVNSSPTKTTMSENKAPTSYLNACLTSSAPVGGLPPGHVQDETPALYHDLTDSSVVAKKLQDPDGPKPRRQPLFKHPEATLGNSVKRGYSGDDRNACRGGGENCASAPTIHSGRDTTDTTQLSVSKPYTSSTTTSRNDRIAPQRRRRRRVGEPTRSASSSKSLPRERACRECHMKNNKRRTEGGRRQENFGDSSIIFGSRTELEPLIAEAAMLKEFECDGKGGVSVSAIRSLYRKRHGGRRTRQIVQKRQEQRDDALDEIRRWWRATASGDQFISNTSGMEASVGYAVAPWSEPRLSDDRDRSIREEWLKTRCHDDHASDDTQDDDAGNEGNNRDKNREVMNIVSSENSCSRTPATDALRAVLQLADRQGGSTISTTTQNSANCSDAKANEDSNCAGQRNRGVDDNSCCFNNLRWSDVLRHDSYRAAIVRDIKRALRGGQLVRLRARCEDGSFRAEDSGGSDGRKRAWKDCELMLRSLYMQLVQFCADPALPPTTRELVDSASSCGGYFVCMTMEPARRYRHKVPQRQQTTGQYFTRGKSDCAGGVIMAAAGDHFLPPMC